MSEATKTRYVDVLEELQENGISLSKFSKEVGLSYSALHSAKAKDTIFGDLGHITRILRGKARILKNYNPKTDSISEVCRDTLIKQTFFAKQIGISKQGLNQYLSPERQVQLRMEVRRVASNINSLASQLEKIKL